VQNVKYINYLGSERTNDAKCTRENIFAIAMAKAAPKKEGTLTANWT